MSSFSTFISIFVCFAFVFINSIELQYAFEETKEINVFREVNENLKNCLHELFSLLEPTEKFRTNTNIKQFQYINENLELISESYYNKYEESLNDVINDTPKGPSLIDFNELFEDVINEYGNIVDSNETIKSKSFMESLIDKYKIPPIENSKSKVKMKALEVWEPEELNGTAQTRRIFEGQTIKISNYPFVVSIHNGQQFLCGGSIVWSDLILSAASCLQLAWNNRLYQTGFIPLNVRVGSSFTYMLGESISVLHLYFHPKYDPKTLQHNLVIVRLKKHLTFSKNPDGIRRIELDRRVRQVPVNVGVVILGWGEKRHSNELKPSYQKLSMATLPIYDLQSCEDIYSGLFVSRHNFCAGYMSMGGGACNRDVGDPGVVGSILMGVVSFGPPVCGTPNSPTVFTMVGHYAEWIEGIMNLPARKLNLQTSRKPIKRTTKQPTTTTRLRKVAKTNKRNVDDVLKNVLVELFQTTYYDQDLENNNDDYLNGEDE